MPVHSPSQMTGVGYAAQRVTKAPNWHTLVAFDMLFNNMTTGLFLVAAAGDLAAPGVFGTVNRLAYPVALLFLLADLLCLVLDLGHRLRFHHMLRVFKPSSPMSFGTWCLTAYSLPLSLIAAIEALRAMGVVAAGGPVAGWVRGLALLAGIPFALGSAAYKGVLFSTTSQPGWKDARWLGGYLTNSAIVIGCAEMLAIATLLGQDRAASALHPALLVLLAINLVFAGLVVVELRPAFREIDGGRLATIAGVGVAAGVILPALVLPAGAQLTPVADVAVAIILGNLAIRWSIVMLPHRDLAVRKALAREGNP
jgi:Ni/Fe-hydrogenase subunit HybB-like protein